MVRCVCGRKKLYEKNELGREVRHGKWEYDASRDTTLLSCTFPNRISNAQTPSKCSNAGMLLLLARLVLLLFPTATFFELLCFLESFLDSLAYLPLLLACLDGNGYTADFTVFGCFADCAFGVLPVGCAGANLVSSYCC